jgi:hypothetical protein
MAFAGHVENGTVVFDQPVSLPNGTPVRVEVVDDRAARPVRPAPGLGKGSILYIAPDFDDTPEEFKEYLE